MDEHNEATSTCTIDQLPDNCLWMVFDQLCLEQIVRLRRVCPRWCSIVDHALTKQTDLKLFASKADLHRYKQRQIEFNLDRHTPFKLDKNEVLILRAQDADWSEILVRQFPNIKALVIESPGNKRLIHELIEAISQWKLTVKQLTFIGWSEYLSARFWQILDSAENLEFLMFFGLYRACIPACVGRFKQLKHFALVHYLHDVVPVFLQLGPNLSFLLISWVYLSVPQLEFIIAQNPSLTTSLRTLRLGYITSVKDHGVDREKNFRQILRFFATHFKNITHISILFADNLPVLEMAEMFSSMKNLTRLSFYLSREQLPHYGKVNWSETPTMESVTSLYVELYAIEAEMFHFWIDRLFPNLKKLTVYTNIDRGDDKFRILEQQLLERFHKLEQFTLKY